MANDAAWQAGWDVGASAAKKPKKGKGTDSSPDVDTAAQKGTGQKNRWSILSYIPKFKQGGRVKKTGLALLHKGEYVIPAQQTHKSRRKAAGKRTVTKI